MKNRRLAVISGILALFLATPALAGKPEVPKTLKGTEIVDSKHVLAAMESGSALLLDARKQGDFESGTVPGSVSCQVSSGKPNLDDANVAATVKKLSACEGLKGADHGKPVIAYCNGDHCWRSPKASLALIKMGFSKVQWYRLGMNDWKSKGLPVE